MPTEFGTETRTERAGEGGRMTFAVEGSWSATGLMNVIPRTAPLWGEEASLELSEETRRAEFALEGHLAMLASLSDWRKVPPDHSHPQLLSEPDD